jgi:hypothetical protein
MKPDAFDDQLKGTLADPKKSDEATELVKANKSIASDRSPNSITITYEGKNNRFVEDLRRVYNFIAESWGYKSMDHMIAIAHTEIVARAVQDPLKFGPAAIKAIAQIQDKIHPKEKITATQKIAGESKQDRIDRLMGHFKKDTPPPS